MITTTLTSDLAALIDARKTGTDMWARVGVEADQDPIRVILEITDAIVHELLTQHMRDDPKHPPAEIILGGTAPEPDLQPALDAALQLVMSRFGSDHVRVIETLYGIRDPELFSSTLAALLTTLVRFRINRDIEIDHLYLGTDRT
jgi:hypothetical protein